MLWMLEAVFESCFKCASKRAAPRYQDVVMVLTIMPLMLTLTLTLLVMTVWMLTLMMLWMLEAVFGSCFKCASKRAVADIKML